MARYETKSTEWIEEDRLELLQCWSRDGYTYQDIANKIGITVPTLRGWRAKHPEIDKALKVGKEMIDYKVENALLKAALGYKAVETRVIITTDRKNGDVVTTTRETVTKDVAPNVTACQVWLYNRLPEKWKRNRDKIIELSDDDNSIQVTVTRAGKNDEDDQINESIQIEPKDQSSKQIDLDYWPDDWEDD